MDLDMWQLIHSTKKISGSQSYGNVLLPGYGELDGGLTGEGRMAEPADILKHHSLSSKEARPERQKCSSPQDLRMSIWIPLGL